MAQRETMAYNGLVIGGTFNRNAYGLMSWSASDDNETRSVRVAATVKDTAPAAAGILPTGLQARLDLMRSLFQEASQSLAIATGTAKTITVDVAVAGPLITLTRTGGDFFASSDLAMPVEIATVGAFQISRFITTSSVECSVPNGITPPGASLGATATIGHELLRCADFADLTNAASAGALDPGDQVGGIKARASVGRPTDIDDDSGRWRIETSWTFQRPALEVRPLANGRIRAQIDRDTTPEGLDVVRFSGTITAGAKAGAGALVLAVLSDAIDTWMATTLTNINATATFENVGGRRDFFDDEGKVLTFNRLFAQKIFGDTDTSAPGFDDPRITGADVSFSRSYQNIHGIKGARQPFQVAINYSAGVTATGPDAVDFAELRNFWAKTLKPYLIGRCKALFGGQVVILAGADPVYDPVSSKIRAAMTVVISKSGSNIYQYDRITSMTLDERFEFDEVFDAKDYTAIYWTAGRSLVGSVSVSVVQLGDPKPNKGTGGAGAGLPGGGIFFSGGALSLSIPAPALFGLGNQAGGAPGEASPNSFTAYPEPGDPGRLFPDQTITGGEWLMTQRKATEKVQYWGDDPDGQGSRVKVTTSQYLGAFIYLVNAKLDARVRPVTPPRGAGGESKSIERLDIQIGGR